MKKSTLTPKEKLFCRLYRQTRNLRESAARAGFAAPERNGYRILAKPAVTAELRRLDAEKAVFDAAGDGLRRLAFGGVADAVKLLFADGITEEQAESLDLFLVSEIKRPKGGGIEIKFFDRLKALEMLSELSAREETDSARSFYEAISKGAQSIEK